MKMKMLQAIVLGASLIATACTANDSLSPWHGEYLYETAAGHTAGGSPITMELTLTIKKSALSESCLFQAVGFQTYKKIVCTLAGNGDNLEVKFKNYEEGTLLKKYKAGEVLFVLEKSDGKDNKTRYVPHWAAYQPFGKDSGIENEGSFVKK
jgi:hypothetical protein